MKNVLLIILASSSVFFVIAENMAKIKPITTAISIMTVKERDKNENVLIKYKAKQVRPNTIAILSTDLYKGS